MLATEEIFADDTQEPATPEPARKRGDEFNFPGPGVDDFVSAGKLE